MVEEISRLYGRAVAPSLDVVTNFAERYAGRDDAFRAALEHAIDYVIYADVFGFFTDTVLIEIPFRHEAVWAELANPMYTHHYSEGWMDQSAEFLERERRARWIFLLLPKHDHLHGEPAYRRTREEANDDDVRRAYDVWLTELGAIGADAIEAFWHESSDRTTADALFALWGAYLLDAPELLRRLLDATANHSAAVVRNAAEIVREAQWGDASDWLFDHVRAQRKAFLVRVGQDRPLDDVLDPRAAILAARLPDGLPARIRPELALRPAALDRLGVEGGWTLHADSTSGLTTAEATAVLQADGDEAIVGLDVDGRGDATIHIGAATRHPAFARVRSVVVRNAELRAFASALATSKWTSDLIAVACTWVTARDLEELAAGSFRLGSLRFEKGGPLGVDGFTALANRDAFAHLRELEAPSPHCRDEGIEAWVDSGRTCELRLLALPNRYSGASVDGMRARGALRLLGSELPNLEQLDLRDHSLGDDALAALAENATLGELTHLRLEGTGITEVGVRALAACPRLRRLEVLDLTRTFAGAGGALAIAESPALVGLHHLRVFAIGDDGAVALHRARFTALRSLALLNSGIADAGAIAIASAPWLARVRVLELDGNAIGPDGAIAIARSPFATGLERVNIYGSPIGAAGVRALLDLPRLKTLGAYACSVGPVASAELQRLRPDVDLSVG